MLTDQDRNQVVGNPRQLYGDYNGSMSALFPDTHPKAEAERIELLRSAPPWRKLEMMGQMNEAVKTMMLSGLRERFPNDPPALLNRSMAELLQRALKESK